MTAEGEVTIRIKEMIADLLDVVPEEVPDHGVIGGLPTAREESEPALLDSLDGLKLGLTIEEEFRVPPPSPDDLPEVVTVADVAQYVYEHVRARNGGKP